MRNEIEQFRQGIFALRTNFGELAQLMIQKDMNLLPSTDNSYDLTDSNGNRIEVKFSRAYKKNVPLTEKNAVQICSNCGAMVYTSEEAESTYADYDCNIQQLKPDCFDFLYYGIFFADKIEIFCAPRSVFPDSLESFLADKEAAREKIPSYSRQHKGGEECQFHMKKKNHHQHHAYYHVKDLTYEELYDLLDSNPA